MFTLLFCGNLLLSSQEVISEKPTNKEVDFLAGRFGINFIYCLLSVEDEYL